MEKELCSGYYEEEDFRAMCKSALLGFWLFSEMDGISCPVPNDYAGAISRGLAITRNQMIKKLAARRHGK